MIDFGDFIKIEYWILVSLIRNIRASCLQEQQNMSLPNNKKVKINSMTDHLSILIIDSNSEDRILLNELLKEAKLAAFIFHCESVAQAYDLLSTEMYDVALLSQNLPDGLGTDLLQRLKDEAFIHCPVIVITDKEESGADVIKRGAHDFLSKEILNANTLGRTVGYAIERHRLWMELKESKAREQRERELRVLDSSELSNATNPVFTKSDLLDEMFDNLVEEYQRLFELNLEEFSYKKEAVKSPDHIREFTRRLGDTGAGPREVVRIHRAVVQNLVKDKTTKREEALTNESRYFLLQLMGELIIYYREKALLSQATHSSEAIS